MFDGYIALTSYAGMVPPVTLVDVLDRLLDIHDIIRMAAVHNAYAFDFEHGSVVASDFADFMPTPPAASEAGGSADEDENDDDHWKVWSNSI